MLYGEKMKQILEKFGVDTSTLPDNLYSTLLDAIYNADVSSGGGNSISGITISDDGLWMDIDGDATPAMFISMHGSDNVLKFTDGVFTLNCSDTSTVYDINGNLDGSNIREGVNIFGHIGTYSGGSSKNTITLDDGTELPMPTLKDGCNYAIIFKGTNYYSMLECQNRFANVNSWISIANDNYTIGTSSVPCYLSQLPVNFNEFNNWTESTEYDTSNAKFTTLGTLILSNEIIETWSSTNTNTHNIYFNKNFEI